MHKTFTYSIVLRVAFSAHTMDPPSSYVLHILVRVCVFVGLPGVGVGGFRPIQVSEGVDRDPWVLVSTQWELMGPHRDP